MLVILSIVKCIKISVNDTELFFVRCNDALFLYIEFASVLNYYAV